MLRPLPEPRSLLRFESDAAPAIDVHLAAPRRLTTRTRLVIVMHGVLRNAGEYAEQWRSWARERDRLVACPCFDRGGWPGGRSYNLGALFTGGRARGELRPAERWAFTIVDQLAGHLQKHFGLVHDDFDLWGHSAGAQFVHRFALLRPRARARRLVAAGAGWYTTPDLRIDFPYGLRDARLALDGRAQLAWTRRDLVLMRGALDVERDEHLRRDPHAEAQGPTRWHRAEHMLARARAADPQTRWRLFDVRDAGHDHVAMARATQALWDARDAARAAPHGTSARPISPGHQKVTTRERTLIAVSRPSQPPRGPSPT